MTAPNTPTQELEPVAWRYRYRNTDWTYLPTKPVWWEDEALNERFEGEPLYSAEAISRLMEKLKATETVRLEYFMRSNATAAAIAKLTAERDDYKLKYNHECNRHGLTQKRAEQLDADRAAIVASNKLLSERVAVLESALEPFAMAAGQRQIMCDDTERVTWSGITVGDLRRALAAREAK